MTNIRVSAGMQAFHPSGHQAYMLAGLPADMTACWIVGRPAIRLAIRLACQLAGRRVSRPSGLHACWLARRHACWLACQLAGRTVCWPSGRHAGCPAGWLQVGFSKYRRRFCGRSFFVLLDLPQKLRQSENRLGRKAFLAAGGTVRSAPGRVAFGPRLGPTHSVGKTSVVHLH